jgi:hypothetical protein
MIVGPADQAGKHICNEACGITFDPACPAWREFCRDYLVDPAAPDWEQQVLLAAEAIELRREWQRRDRACRRALRLMVEDPDLPAAILWLFEGELRDLAREALQGVIAEVLAEDLPGALALLEGGTPR